MITGEDLCNVPPVALLQDLNVQAHLGNASVERNGHHYFAGTKSFALSIAEALNTELPQLFEPSDQVRSTLRITTGTLDLTGLTKQPALGLAAPLDL